MKAIGILVGGLGFCFVLEGAAAPAPSTHRPSGTTGREIDSRSGLTPGELSCLTSRLLSTEPKQSLSAPISSRIRLFPDGKKLLVVSADSATIHDLESNTATAYPGKDTTASLYTTTIAPDGKHFYIHNAEKVIEVDVATKDRRELVATNPSGQPHFGSAPNISPDSKWMITTDSSFRGPGALLWDLTTGKSRALPLGGYKADDAKFSPDGRSLIASVSEGFIRWEAPFDKAPTLLPIESDSTRSFALSPDGKTLLSVRSQALTQFRLSDGAVIRTTALPEKTGLEDIVVSKDGSRALVGGGFSGSAQLVDLASGRTGRRFEGHAHRGETTGVGSVDFSADGKQVAVMGLSQVSLFALGGEDSLGSLREGLAAKDSAARETAIHAAVECMKTPGRWLEHELRGLEKTAFPTAVKAAVQAAWEAGTAADIAKLMNDTSKAERSEIARAIAKRFVDGLNDDQFTTRERITSLLNDVTNAVKGPAFNELRKYLFLAAHTEADPEALARLQGKQLGLVAPASYGAVEPGLTRYSLLRIANQAGSDNALRALRRRLNAELYGE